MAPGDGHRPDRFELSFSEHVGHARPPAQGGCQQSRTDEDQDVNDTTPEQPRGTVLDESERWLVALARPAFSGTGARSRFRTYFLCAAHGVARPAGMLARWACARRRRFEPEGRLGARWFLPGHG